jgi:uncharacterized membrane protein
MTTTVLAPPPARAPAASSARVASVDLIRGAVMVLMAIDHVRVFAGVPAGGPAPGVFFTRWVTHFCAPAFLFLAGTSAWFYGRKHPGLSRFLLSRGAWLVVLELTFLRLAWTFNADLAGYAMAGVIWCIGWCMILMAGLVKLPLPVVGGFGAALMALHNLLDGRLFAIAGSLGQGFGDALWRIFYIGFWAGPIQVAGPDGPSLIVLYSIIPWVGVMAAGYAFGRVLTFEPARRDRLCLAIGLGATAAFLVLRGFDLYGDPNPWTTGGDEGPPALLGFLNTTKYPASLLFLLMTLGPTIALIPLLERTRGALARWVTVFGRVPFFFYVLHIPLIHALALVVSRVRAGAVDPWLFADHPMGAPPPPDGYAWGLPLLYAVWLLACVILYFACRWFADLKARRSEWWLRYL